MAGNLNSQNTAILQAADNIDPNPNKNKDLTIVDDSAIENEMGPLGTVSQIASSTQNNTISVYTVKPGDTLSEIASLFNVSTDTILYANDLKSEKDLVPGSQLVILPVSGLYYTVVKGDTLSSIAKKFKVDSADILSFNDFASASDLAVGTTIVIPGAEVSSSGFSSSQSSSSSSSSGSTKSASKGQSNSSVPASLSGYLIRPVSASETIKTQGLHGKYRTAVDLASVGGTHPTIHAAASGVVIIAKDSGWNGGYGNYIVIQHSNGLQTLYAHLSKIEVSSGQAVNQGDEIGVIGDTGNSTGTHLHFELWGTVDGWKVRNWNPFN